MKFLTLIILALSFTLNAQSLRKTNTDTIESNISGGGVDFISPLSINSSLGVSTILDEDNMVSDSATALVTQQSVKAYSDALISSINNIGDVTITGAASGEVLTWSGSAWVNSAPAGGVSAWVTATVYPIDEMVHEGTRLYIALTNHTSGTFQTDLAADDWKEISKDFYPWVSAFAYKIGTVVHESNKIYVALTDHVSGAFATDLGNLDWVELSNDANILNDLTDVTITAAATGKVLQYTGAAWEDQTQTSQYVIHDSTGNIETVEEMFDETVNQGIFEAITISDDGGLNFSWSVGEVYDFSAKSVVAIATGSAACTDNAVTYLYWDTGGALSSGTTKPTGNQVDVATIACQSGDIVSIHNEPALLTREYDLIHGLEDLAPLLVATGLVVSEDIDVTNVWDIETTAGEYYIDAHKEIVVPVIQSRITAMVRHFHTAGLWASDTNAEIDATQYDDGTNLVAGSSGQYYKSCFWIDGGIVHWVYPTAGFNLVSAAINASCPNTPPGLVTIPRVMAVVVRENDGALPSLVSGRWIDIRPLLGATTAGGVTDHGNLIGLSDDDHTQYALLAGRTGGQTIQGGNAASEILTLESTSNATKGHVLSLDPLAIGENIVTGSINGVSTTSQLVSSVDNDATMIELVLNHYNDSSATGSVMYGARSRGTFAAPTIVQDGDNLLDLFSAGFDGTDWAIATGIRFEVDGTPGSDDMPGRMIFETSPDGSQAGVEALRIDSSQTSTFAGDVKGNVSATKGRKYRDFLFTGEAEYAVVGDITTGQDALFDNGGTISGGIAIITSGLLEASDTANFEYDGNATSSVANDFWYHTTTQVDEDKTLGFNFYYRSSGVAAADGDIKVVVKCTTSGDEIYSKDLEVQGSSTLYPDSVFVPSGCGPLKFGFHVVTGRVGGEVLWNRFSVNTNPFVYKNLIDEESVELGDANGFGSTNNKIRIYDTVVTNTSGSIISYTTSAADGMSITALKDCSVSGGFSDQYSAGSATTGISVNSNQLTTAVWSITKTHRKAQATSSGAGNAIAVSWNGELSAGDVLRVHGSGTSDGTSAAHFSITAQATTEHVVTPAKSHIQEITLGDGNGHGSSSTMIRRFTTTVKTEGSGIISDSGDSATLGREFTALKKCLVAVSYSDSRNAATANAGISVNSNQLTTDIQSIAKTHRKAWGQSVPSTSNTTMWTGIMNVGDILRPHTNSTADGTVLSHFSITAIDFEGMALAGIPTLMGPQYSEAAGDFTVTGTNWTTVETSLVPFETRNGIWKMQFNIVGVLSSTTSAFTGTISGVTFLTVTEGQAITAQLVEDGVANRITLINNASSGNGNFIVGSSGGAFNRIAISGTVKIEKPTFVP